MLRRIVAGFTFLAFVNSLMGCMVSSVEKVPGMGAQTIEAKEEVVELVLLDGSTVTFDDNGGNFTAVPRDVVRGRSLTGDTIVVPLNEAWQCRTRIPKSLSPAELDTARILELVLEENTLVMFAAPGARYDKKADRIKGEKVTRGTESYRLNEAISIRGGRPAVIRVDELKRQPEQRVSEIIDKRYHVYTFDSTGGQLTSMSGFYGTTVDGEHVSVVADDVLYAAVKRTDPALSAVATLGVIIAIAGVIALIAIATKQSCPFVYSFDGEQFVFDAEPLGGAICPGLARTDLSRLDYVKPVDGEYRLLIRNEVPETQYVNRMRMLLVDHAPQTSIYPDLQGNFYAFTNVLDATSATDENGMSLMKFIHASDNVAWQTHLPSASKEIDGPTRHGLTITLPKPVDAQKAWLITNIGTSSWGSNMIRKTVEYRGNSAPAWLASLTPGSEASVELDRFLQREETYQLKTWVKEGVTWSQATTIVGQGPLISEDRVYPIDVSNVVGDSLVVRFNPPKGFWTLDYLGISYDEPTVVNPVRIGARWAEDQSGAALLPALNSADTMYYTMPEVGDIARVNFAVPPLQEGTVRSVYLETSGYYELHLQKEMKDQLGRLYSIGINPGQIVKTALEEYQVWRAEQIAKQQPQ